MPGMTAYLKEDKLSIHAGHPFFVTSDYGILELACLKCDHLPEVGSAHPSWPTAQLWQTHRNHDLACDGAKVYCDRDGAVLARYAPEGQPVDGSSI